MSRRIGAAGIVLLALLVLDSSQTDAAGETETDDGCIKTVDGDSVEVECVDPGPKVTPTRAGVIGAPEPCRWVRGTAVEGWDASAYGDLGPSGYQFTQGADGSVGRAFPDGRTEVVFERVCPDGSQGFVWIDTSITVRDVIDDAVGRAKRAVPSPTLDLSPSPEAGGIVNLGLWLALTGQDPVTVRAEAGSLWAEATVTLASTTWDMGNGDVVTCDGAGTAIVDTDTLDEGPCGYTYLQSSPEDDPFPLSVTASWAVTYRSSGGSGSSGTIDRTLSVDYDVDEIQTVGVSN